MKSFACNVKVNAIEYFHIKLNANEEIKSYETEIEKPFGTWSFLKAKASLYSDTDDIENDMKELFRLLSNDQ